MTTWMCTTQGLNVFAPVREDDPAWMTQHGAQAGGYIGLMGSCLEDLRPLLAAFGHLFISSANSTKRPPAVTASEADASFGERLLVIDGDPARDPGQRHGSATIVRISSAASFP